MGDATNIASQFNNLDLEVAEDVPEEKEEVITSIDSDLPYADSFRFLRLEPGTAPDPLTVRLCLTRLDSGQHYEAISYVWGSPDSRHAITINGEEGWITENLAFALLQIRSSSQTLNLWADQICINQNNIEERNQQVKFMARIFSNASRVYVCLGPDFRDHAAPAFETISKLSLKIRKYKYERNHKRGPSVTANNMDSYKKYKWKSFREMGESAWFRRAWCVQEVCLAKSALILWGEERVDWSDLMEVQLWIRRPGILLARHYDISFSHCRLWSSFNRNEAEVDEDDDVADGGSFLKFLDIARRKLLASDPRDYIYAFLGHPRAQAVTITPQYQRSIGEICLDFTTKWLVETKDSSLLSFVRHFELPEANNRFESDCPSWCPRWFAKTKCESLLTPRAQRSWFDASLSDDFKFTLDGDKIHIRGVVLDVIDRAFSELAPRCTNITPSQRKKNILPKVVAEILEHIGDPARYDEYLKAISSVLVLGLDDVRYRKPVGSKVHSLSNALLVATEDDREAIPEEIVARWQHFSRPKDPILYARNVTMITNKNRLFLGKTGLVGLAHNVAMEGDKLCIVYGCKIPLLLRPSSPGLHMLVGPCYVNGLMLGEGIQMIAERGLLSEEFVIH